MFHTIQKFLKKEQLKTPLTHNSKKQFLSEHNKLSPLGMQATTSLLSRFRMEKSSLFKNEDWSIDKLRRPFIMWLTSLTAKEKDNIEKRGA